MEPSRFQEFSRREWARFADSSDVTLEPAEIRDLTGFNDVLSLDEVQKIYLPIQWLLNLCISTSVPERKVVDSFIGHVQPRIPFMVGIVGSVAVGKTSIARLLRRLLSELPVEPTVELVATDGFLLPNSQLEKRGLMKRKGFPESYDLSALVSFLSSIRAGVPEVSVPVYSHHLYDRIPGAVQVVSCPDVLILEGLNLLLDTFPADAPHPSVLVSDFLDFSIYVDAEEQHIREWYIDRFLALRNTAFRDPASYFCWASALGLDEAVETAGQIWTEVNRPNLFTNILPTRHKANLILEKGADHLVQKVLFRRN